MKDEIQEGLNKTYKDKDKDTKEKRHFQSVFSDCKLLKIMEPPSRLKLETFRLRIECSIN